MAVVIVLVMMVDILLLYATGRLLRSRTCLWRYALATLLSGIFTTISMLEDFPFLGSFPWQICIIVMTGLVAFGHSRESFRSLLLFTLLRLSVGGVAEKETVVSMLLGAAGIGFACISLSKKSKLIPVELYFGGKTYHITALYDTGNALRDPVTGRGVMIVDVNVARSLTGLEISALQDPVSNLVSFPGLRLIPYQSVGDSGFLLALRIPEAKVGNRKESVIVALSPNLLSKQYQALTGGNL